MRLAFIDLDGVVADSTERFDRAAKAKQAAIDTLFPERAEREGTKIYWETAFTPDLIDLDTVMPGVAEALDRIERHNYRVMFLTSRPESLRPATEAWLHKHNLFVDAANFQREMILKASGFQYVKTVVWKVGMIQQISALFGATSVLFVDDEMDIRHAVRMSEVSFPLEVAGTLKAAVNLLGE